MKPTGEEMGNLRQASLGGAHVEELRKAGLWSTVFVAAMSVTLSAWAGEGVGPRKVLDVGCHNINGNGTCYVTLDGSAFGSTLGCAIAPTTQFRFDNGDTTIGGRAYASFLAALMAGKSVFVSLDGCTVQGYPQLLYFSVLN